MATLTRTRKTAEQRKHEHFLNLARLLRAGRLHRVELVNGHAEHTFENGEHVDFYESSRYAGFAYMVVATEHGYECGCESFEHRHGSCSHCMDASARAAARYREAKRQNEPDAAAVVAPLVLGSFARDLDAHVADEMPVQPEPELPAVLRDGEGLYYVLTGDTYRVMSAHDLRQIGPYREGGEQDRERLAVMLSQPVQDEHERKMAANQAYRDVYPGDYGYCDAA